MSSRPLKSTLLLPPPAEGMCLGITKGDSCVGDRFVWLQVEDNWPVGWERKQLEKTKKDGNV